jgi:DNA-binding transcriptional MerR regulator
MQIAHNPGFKVGQIAKELDVTPNTIRNWSKLYAAWLSPEAAQTDAQTARKYNLRDLEVLRAVAAMRAEGKIHTEIVEALNGMAFPDIVDDQPQPEAAQLPPQAPQQAQDAPQLPALVVDMLRDEIRAVRLQTDQTQRQQRDRMTMFLYGLMAGLLAGVLLFWLAYLLATIGP